MVVQQAMAAGLAVVASRVGGIPQQVEHDVNGLLFDAGDVEALASLLARLHDEPGLASRLAKAGRIRAERRYDAASVAVGDANGLRRDHPRSGNRRQRRTRNVTGRTPSNSGWNVPRILWLVLVVALLIRLWGIGYGLPFSYVNDEYHEVMRALQLGAGSFNFDRIGKGGFYLAALRRVRRLLRVAEAHWSRGLGGRIREDVRARPERLLPDGSRHGGPVAVR